MDLDKLSVWSERNFMPFNVEKCKVMHIGKSNIKAEYKLLNQKISITKEEKDLGVIFTEKFFSSANCSKSSKSANKVIGLIRRNIINKSEDEMLIMYKTLIRSILDYCIPVWKPHYKKDITQLEKIQKRFTKMVKGCKRLTYEQPGPDLYFTGS